MKKTALTESIDLRKAKEEVERQKWAKTLPEFLKEYEDAEGAVMEAGSSSPVYQESSQDPWKKKQRVVDSDDEEEEELEEEHDVEEDTSLTAESDTDNMDEGCVAEDMQEGTLGAGLIARMKNYPNDVTPLGERKIRVDLSFIKNSEDAERLRLCFEKVIKLVTSIPGKVTSEKEPKSQIFTFHLSNQFFSPDTDSSGNDLSPKPPNPKGGNKRKTVKKETSQISFPYKDELEEGVVLEPKFPGIPKLTLKIGTYGITEANVILATKSNPGCDLMSVLKFVLNQTGNLRKVKNLHKI